MYSVQCIDYINPYLLINHEDFTFGIFIVRLIFPLIRHGSRGVTSWKALVFEPFLPILTYLGWDPSSTSQVTGSSAVAVFCEDRYLLQAHRHSSSLAPEASLDPITGVTGTFVMPQVEWKNADAQAYLFFDRCRYPLARQAVVFEHRHVGRCASAEPD